MSRVIAVAGGGTRSKKVNSPSCHSKVSKITSETCTLSRMASSSSVRIFSWRRAWPIRAPRSFPAIRSMASSLTLPIFTSRVPKRRCSAVEVAKTGRPSRRKSLVS